jgi:hypothetical protein
MKKYFLVFLTLFSLGVKAQSNDRIVEYNVKNGAERIANKMKGTLLLTEDQIAKIITLNEHIHRMKLNVQKQFAGKDSLMQKQMQIEENNRDVVYKSVLTEQQYLEYLKNKKDLLQVN